MFAELRLDFMDLDPPQQQAVAGKRSTDKASNREG
jgi:hypothetical protein